MGNVRRSALTLLLFIASTATGNEGYMQARVVGSTPPIVAIIGGGLAGLSAALEAVGSGNAVRVVLLDKEPRIGGNSAKATSGINAAVSPAQRARGITDTFEWFKEDVLKSGGGRAEPSLVETITFRSQEALSWLTEGFGLNLTALSHGGGHRVPRTHRFPPLPDGRPVPMGYTTISAVHNRVKEAGDAIQVITGAKVTKLLQDPKTAAVTGLEYSLSAPKAAGGAAGAAAAAAVAVQPPRRLDADAVVMATGGFAYDRSAGSLMSEFAPQLLHLATTSGVQATGDGIHLCRALGAAVVDMDQIQIHPTGLVDPKDVSNPNKFLGPEALRGEGALLVDGAGRRFTDELGLRAAVTQAIFDRGFDLRSLVAREEGGGGGAVAEGKTASKMEGKTAEGLLAAEAAAAEAGAVPPKAAYLLMNEEAAERFGIGFLNFYKGKGLIREAAGTAAVVDILKLPSDAALRETITEYNTAAAAGSDKFGKTAFPVRDIDPDGKFFVAIVTPSIHYTMGGVRIDLGTRVLAPHRGAVEGAEGGGSDFEPIEGLYAAGEVTGGVHGANRMVGNSLLECVVMGRAAGAAAAAKAAERHKAVEAEAEAVAEAAAAGGGVCEEASS